ncbi:MAG: EscU/YscU/HrcU family type III secretion system export apparatus switch protein [Wolinella sp.]
MPPLGAKAAALAYDQQKQRAPKLLAKGKGLIAEQIIKKAKEFEIPLFQNELLVDSLLDAPLDTEIPPALYRAVVEVFIWLYQSEKKAQLSG